MTQNELFAKVRSLGLSIRKTGYGNELRLAYKGRSVDTEASAYYTDDRDDALATAINMTGRCSSCGNKQPKPKCELCFGDIV